jgi:hypothetical protein
MLAGGFIPGRMDWKQAVDSPDRQYDRARPMLLNSIPGALWRTFSGGASVVWRARTSPRCSAMVACGWFPSDLIGGKPSTFT